MRIREIIRDHKQRSYSRLSYHTYVSPKHTYFYLGTGKVACTKIKLLLHELEGYPAPDDLLAIHSRKQQDRDFLPSLLSFSDEECVKILTSGDYFRFCFVRNPYFRLFSAYKSKFFNYLDPQYHWLRDRIREKYDYPIRDGRRSGMVAFRDFVRYLREDPATFADAHWCLQTYHIMLDTIYYDLIGRIEDFERDFGQVLSRIGAPAKFMRNIPERINTTARLYHAAAYDKELADTVYYMYEDDFETFGYDRDSWLFDFEKE